MPEDVGGHAELARRIRTPVAVGEAMRNRYEFADWLGRRALRLAQPDVARTGITEAMSIAELASAHHVPVACHHSVGLGIALAAGIHVSSACADTRSSSTSRTPSRSRRASCAPRWPPGPRGSPCRPGPGWASTSTPT
ncbi:enolase C-terminal domain-like protein [Amycolatopsis methanolica]|uniref:enolase C-terminal domain-like protein n=1 Tax=Amycolatopsis methanolica TaxID=1814 RepID=UPI00039E44EB|nr:enolase C-terminal domain-like protein [Amycolatopsis methanolica]